MMLMNLISIFILDHSMKHRLVTLTFLLIAISLIVLKSDWWLILLTFSIWLFITFLGVVNMDFHFFLRSSIQPENIQTKKIAITLDDGPTSFTPKFLEMLHQYDQKATFFCIGKQIEKHPEILRKIIEDGHEVGIHSYSHSNRIGFYSSKKMKNEIFECDEMLRNTGNIRTELYRPPFGITNPHIAAAIKVSGKKSIGWSIRTFDTAISDEKKIVRSVLPKIKPGSVILLHDTSTKSLKVLEQILLFLQRENYQSVTVSELFNWKKI